jgi:hypothetical protein
MIIVNAKTSKPKEDRSPRVEKEENQANNDGSFQYDLDR